VRCGGGSKKMPGIQNAEVRSQNAEVKTRICDCREETLDSDFRLEADGEVWKPTMRNECYFCILTSYF
jgi:hypothetical protein